MPIRRVDGKFAVSGSEGSYTIAADNAARYAKYVKFAEAVDSRKLAVFYFHYYPLFQQSYRELGYPKGHFNDRLVEVIDHLLAAPELQGPVARAAEDRFDGRDRSNRCYWINGYDRCHRYHWTYGYRKNGFSKSLSSKD